MVQMGCCVMQHQLHLFSHEQMKGEDFPYLNGVNLDLTQHIYSVGDSSSLFRSSRVTDKHQPCRL